MFVHLHNHYLIDSSMRIEPAVQKAVQDAHPAIAITDHNLVSLHIRFFNECLKHKIKPVFGCECYFVDSADMNFIENDKNKEHILILAKNPAGLANLYNIVSRSRIKYPLKEKTSLVDWKTLELYKEGLIVTNACIYGVLANQVMKKNDYVKRAERFINIFGEDFYFEIGYHYFPDQRYANLKIIELAEKFGRTPVLVNDCHHLSKEDWYIHNMIFRKSFRVKDGAYASETQDSYFKTEEEMSKLGYDGRFLTETSLLADRVEYINPIEVLKNPPVEPFSEDGEYAESDFCLASKLVAVSAKESALLASEYFGIDGEELNGIISKIDDSAGLAENVESNGELRDYFESNPLVKEAAFKLEGIITDITPDFENIITDYGPLPLTNCNKLCKVSQFCSEDIKDIFEIRSVSEFKRQKSFINKLSVFSGALKKYDMEDNKSAIEEFVKLENDEEFGNAAKYYIANAYYFSNNFRKAGEYYNGVLYKEFDDEKKYWINYYLGWINHKYYKDSLKARELLLEAAELGGVRGNAYYLLGIICYDSKEYEQSKNYFKVFLSKAKKKEKSKIIKTREYIEKIDFALNTKKK